jgi:hypothetical protein
LLVGLVILVVLSKTLLLERVGCMRFMFLPVAEWTGAMAQALQPLVMGVQVQQLVVTLVAVMAAVLVATNTEAAALEVILVTAVVVLVLVVLAVLVEVVAKVTTLAAVAV